MSKKIAGGADKILIDIKCGEGALIKNYADALKLKNIMERIGKFYNRETICEVTDMNIPLGSNIGNALEVMEAIEVLKGKKSSLTDLSIKLASEMVKVSLNISFEEAKDKVINSLESGIALEKFYQFVKYQGGKIEELKISDFKQEIKSK